MSSITEIDLSENDNFIYSDAAFTERKGERLIYANGETLHIAASILCIESRVFRSSFRHIEVEPGNSKYLLESVILDEKDTLSFRRLSRFPSFRRRFCCLR